MATLVAADESFATAAAGPRTLGGRGLGPDIRTGATALYLSRCLTRAKSSGSLTRHRPLSTNHRRKGGTVNRPCTHVTHTKQTTGSMQGRNVPMHLLNAKLSIERGSLPVASTTKTVSALSPQATRHSANLPGTVNRIETHVTYRKQTLGYCSTRNLASSSMRAGLFIWPSLARAHSSRGIRPANAIIDFRNCGERLHKRIWA
jgi:hypothetical protein